MAVTYNILPKKLLIEGVMCTSTDQQGAGGFADVFCGTYDGEIVALKRVRVFALMPEDKKAELRKVSVHQRFCHVS